MIKPPEGMTAQHPAWIIGTWFGSGLVPKIPGTAASLAALPFAWIIQARFGAAGLAVAALLALAAGTWACRKLLSADNDDPGHIVIDEVAGQWLTLAFPAILAPAPDPIFYGTGFALFRFFDILKPWPIDWVERRLAGAAGVMGDDVLAGIFAGAGTAFIYAYAHALGPFSA